MGKFSVGRSSLGNKLRKEAILCAIVGLRRDLGQGAAPRCDSNFLALKPLGLIVVCEIDSGRWRMSLKRIWSYFVQSDGPNTYFRNA